MWLRLCRALPNVSSVVKSRNPHTIHEQHQYSRLDKLHGHIPHLNAAAKLPWWQYGRLRDGSGPVAKTSLLYQALLPDSFIDFLFPLHLLFLFGHGATVVCIAHSPLHALPPFPSLHTSYRRLWCLSATVVISAVVSLSVTSYSFSLRNNLFSTEKRVSAAAEWIAIDSSWMLAFYPRGPGSRLQCFTLFFISSFTCRRYWRRISFGASLSV